MQTAELLVLMRTLKLRGMRGAFEETLSEDLKRKHSFHQIIGKLLAAEAEERRLRSVRYQLTVADLPLPKSPRCLPVRQHPDHRGADPAMA